MKPIITESEYMSESAGPRPPVLLDVRWQLGGPNGRADYEAGHIPGAVYVDLDSELAGPAGSGGRHPLPDPEAFGADRERIRLALEAEDIEARPLWKPMHLQPIYASHLTFGGDVSARLFERGLCLPSGSALTDEQQDRVAAGMLAARTSAVPG